MTRLCRLGNRTAHDIGEHGDHLLEKGAAHSLASRTSLVKTVSTLYRQSPVTSLEAIASRLPPSLTHWPGFLLTFIAEDATDRFERELAAYGIRTRHASVLVVSDAEGP